MNVANLELCKELKELSDWNDPDAPSHYDEDHQFVCSLYTLGFLLRKLPAGKAVEYSEDRGWAAIYDNTKRNEDFIVIRKEADTPENAAAKLCIELIKQNILQPSAREVDT